MAEILPAVIERRWTRDVRPVTKSRLFPRRLRALLVLTCLLMLSAGGAAGVMAWWRPIVPPAWIVLAIARGDTATVERCLSLAGDAYAMVALTQSKTQNFVRTSGLTRRECEQLLNGLRLVRTRDRLCLYIAGAAGLNRRGEVVLFPSDIAPSDSDSAIPLADVLAAMESCDTKHRLLVLDLSPVESSALEVVPATGVRESLTTMLKQRKLHNLKIITSASPGDRIAFVPGQCRSVFGLYVQRALEGHADGCNPQDLHDGRVNLSEFIAYVTENVPGFSLHGCGFVQQPQCFGAVDDFELSVAKSPLRHTDEMELVTEASPAWLVNAWKSHRDAFKNGSFAADTSAYRNWTGQILAAELAWANAAPAPLLKRLETEYEESRQLFHDSPLPSRTLAPAADPLVVKSVQGFVAAWKEQVLTALPTAQNGVAAKLLGDFVKAQAKVEPEALRTAVLEVAQTNSEDHVNNLEPLSRLLNAYPQLPSTSRSELLQALATIARENGNRDWSVNDAQRALRIAAATEAATQALAAWPWTKSAVDSAWNERVRAEILLAARGYAPLTSASAALQNAEADAMSLIAAINALQRAKRIRDEALVLLPGYQRLMENDAALRTNWLQAAEAMRELNEALTPPRQAASDGIVLRHQIDGINRCAAALLGELEQLQRPLTSEMVAQRIAECRDPNADARDLRAAMRLMASPLLAGNDRAELTKAYRELALRLTNHALASTTAIDGEYARALSNPERRMEYRAQMAAHWRALLATEKQNSKNDVSGYVAERDAWYNEAVRYRQLQWQRVYQVSGDHSSSRPTAWLGTGIDILGPFSCADLSRQRSRVDCDIQWQQRGDQAAQAKVFVTSPCADLTITPMTDPPRAGEPIRLRLHWQPSNDDHLQSPVSGFLLGIEVRGRFYFAPVQLPHLNDQALVALTLSANPTQCVPLDNPYPLAANGTAQPLYLYVRNVNAQPRQVQLNCSGMSIGAPLSLAPFAIQRVDLPAPASGTRSALIPLQFQALDVTDQKVIGQTSFAFAIRQPDKLVTVLQSQLGNDPAQGVTATVDVQAAQAIDQAVPLALSLHYGHDGTPLRVLGGQLQSALLPATDRAVLHASGVHASPGDRVQAWLNIDGVPSVLVLEGIVPAPGANSPLTLVTAPSLSLTGPSPTIPDPKYPLELAAANAPTDSKMRVELVSETNPTNPVLQRTLAAHAEPILAWQATTPPGGWNVALLARRGEEAFDTSGFVGRFIWQANLVDRAGTNITSTRLPVVFDNSPPLGARFVRPPAGALKGTQITLLSTGWDDLSDIVSVQYFLGSVVDNKLPPGAKLIAAQPSREDQSLWSADVVLPSEIGPCVITAVVTNGAGLTTFATTTINLIAASATPVGKIQGVIVEGNRPQAQLEVILLKAAGGEVSRTKSTTAGEFTFANVPSGEYHLTTSKPASQRKAAATVKVEADQTASPTLKLAM